MCALVSTFENNLLDYYNPKKADYAIFAIPIDDGKFLYCYANIPIDHILVSKSFEKFTDQDIDELKLKHMSINDCPLIIFEILIDNCKKDIDEITRRINQFSRHNTIFEKKGITKYIVLIKT
jgi:hypothetical protein